VATEEEQGTDYYSKLGVRRVINAWGSSTVLGGSESSPEVVLAMEQANTSFVEMDDLLRRSGDYIADVLGTEAAYVTAGAAGAIALGTAACMTGVDEEKVRRIPDTTGMKNEVVLQKAQRYRYDRCFTMPGARLVEAGDADGCTKEQLAAAIGDSTAAVAYQVQYDRPDTVLSIEDAMEVAHDHGVPVISDAAPHNYPLDYFRRNAQAADLVCFSAKYFQAPQTIGIICGRRDLIEAVRANGFTAYHAKEAGVVEAMTKFPAGAWGRTMKVDRQALAGGLAALDRWFSMDHEDRILGYRAVMEAIQAPLEGVRHVESEVVDVPNFWQVELQVRLDSLALGKTAEQVATELDAGDPRVWVAFFGDDLILIKTNTMTEGDGRILGDRLRAVLTQS
jgi:L-seryl-tRNA(Ser) seleniumtransferase